jgi:hypothetical protein
MYMQMSVAVNEQDLTLKMEFSRDGVFEGLFINRFPPADRKMEMLHGLRQRN